MHVVSLELFSTAIIRLEEVDPNGATDDHMIHLFTTLARTNNSSLKKLYITSMDFTTLPADIFSQAILKMEDVCLGDSYVTAGQVKAVLSSILRASAKDVNLKIFEVSPIFDDDEEDIDPQVLSKAKERVNLVVR